MIICGKHIRHHISRNLCKAMLQTLHRDEPVVAGIGTRQNTPRQRWLHDWELGAEEDGRARHPYCDERGILVAVCTESIWLFDYGGY